jgi:RNA polymerase sigma-70 factor (ECF subfamily)
LTQEAFLQLFRKIDTFRGESAFASWLYRLTTNIALMRFRKKKLISTSLDEFTTSDEENSGPRKEIGEPDLRLTGLFDRVNLQKAIDQLPEGCKALFILHDVKGYQHNEIAKMLGCSIGTSKSQVHRARKRLRKILQSLQHYGTQQSREMAGDSLVLAGNY